MQLRSKKELIENFIATINVSRFGGGSRHKKKLTIMDKLKAFFEKYFGLVSPTEPIAESKVVDYSYTASRPLLGMVAEAPIPYGEEN